MEKTPEGVRTEACLLPFEHSGERAGLGYVWSQSTSRSTFQRQRLTERLLAFWMARRHRLVGERSDGQRSFASYCLVLEVRCSQTEEQVVEVPCPAVGVVISTKKRSREAEEGRVWSRPRADTSVLTVTCQGRAGEQTKPCSGKGVVRLR